MAGVLAFVVTLLVVCCQNSLAMQQHQLLQPQQHQPQQLQHQQLPQVAEQLEVDYLARLMSGWQLSQPEPGSGKFFTSETTAVVTVRGDEFGCFFNDSFYAIGGSEWNNDDACLELHCVLDEQSPTGMSTIVQQLRHCGPAMPSNCVPSSTKSETCCPKYTCPQGVKEMLRQAMPPSEYDLLKFAQKAGQPAGNKLPSEI